MSNKKEHSKKKTNGAIKKLDEFIYILCNFHRLSLKTDAEGALKGNQWPLSSYGPFRDKPCLPNFIEDQSFEEARHLCEFYI